MHYDVDFEVNLSDEAKLAIASLIAENKPSFLERRMVYTLKNGDTVALAQNIFKANLLNHQANSFYVISNLDYDLVGQGAFSKVRRIKYALHCGANGTIHIEPCSDKVVRIKNKKSAQRNRVISGKEAYQHQIAIDEYYKASDFDYFQAEFPVEREITKYQTGKFSKSYTAMSELDGDDAIACANQFYYFDPNKINYEDLPNTKKLINFLILPLLENYKKYFSDRSLSHRDLKPLNLKMKLGEKNASTLIYYLDVDTKARLGEQDSSYGTPGYMAPEIFSSNDLKVSAQRDIFSLGMILIGLINPDLEIEPCLFDILELRKIEKTGANAIHFFNEFVKVNDCFDPIIFMVELSNHANFFNRFYDHSSIKNIKSVHENIINIVKKMTSYDPSNRYSDINQIIAEFKIIAKELDLKSEKRRKSSGSSTTKIVQSMMPEDGLKVFNAARHDDSNRNKITPEKVKSHKENSHSPPKKVAMGVLYHKQPEDMHKVLDKQMLPVSRKLF